MKNQRALYRGFLYAMAALLLCISASTAHAQTSTGVLDDVLDRYQAATAAWSTRFLYYGNALFWILAAIEFSWVAISLGLRQADLQEWVSDLVRWILITGLFWAILLNGTTWVPAIVNSFRQAADSANQAYDSTLPASISPSSLMDLCLNLAARVCDSATAWNPASLVFVGLFGIAILLGGAYVAMLLVCAIVEMYLVTAASMLLLGFGGSRWTRDYATKVLTYAVSVGVKLMVMQLLIGLGQRFLNDFVIAYTNFSVENVSPIIVALVVLCGLVRSIPNIAQSMISGTHIHTGGGLGAAMGAAAMAGSAAQVATTAVMGGTGVLAGATKLAAAQGMNTAAGTAGAPASSSMGLGASIMKGINFTGRVAGNIAKAATDDVKDGMKGHRSPHTNMAQRMTGNMSGQASKHKDPEQKKSGKS